MSNEEFRTLYSRLPPEMTTNQSVAGQFFGRNAYMISGYSTGRRAVPVEIANLLRCLIRLHEIGQLAPMLANLERKQFVK